MTDAVDPVRAYVDLSAKTLRAANRLSELAGLFRKVADGVQRHPAFVRFDDEPRREGENSATSCLCGHSAAWPSAAGLRTMLNEFHGFGAQLKAAWEAVPQDERLALKPPGEILATIAPIGRGR